MLTRELAIYDFIDEMQKQENNFVWCKSIIEQALSGLEVFDVNHKNRAEGELQQEMVFFLAYDDIFVYVCLALNWEIAQQGRPQGKDLSVFFLTATTAAPQYNFCPKSNVVQTSRSGMHKCSLLLGNYPVQQNCSLHFLGCAPCHKRVPWSSPKQSDNTNKGQEI